MVLSEQNVRELKSIRQELNQLGQDLLDAKDGRKSFPKEEFPLRLKQLEARVAKLEKTTA